VPSKTDTFRIRIQRSTFCQLQRAYGDQWPALLQLAVHDRVLDAAAAFEVSEPIPFKHLPQVGRSQITCRVYQYALAVASEIESRLSWSTLMVKRIREEVEVRLKQEKYVGYMDPVGKLWCASCVEQLLALDRDDVLFMSIGIRSGQTHADEPCDECGKILEKGAEDGNG